MECDYEHGSRFYFALNQTAEGKRSYVFHRRRASVSEIAPSILPLANSTPEKNTPEVSIRS